MQNTFVIIKPDAVARGLVGKITSRFEDKGLQLISCNMMLATEDLLRQHYSHLTSSTVFPQIVQSMTAGPLLLQVWRGLNSVHVIRTMLGATDPQSAMPGTIRGDYGMNIGRNLCHASDTPENAEREIKLWNAHILNADNTLQKLIYRS